MSRNSAGSSHVRRLERLLKKGIVMHFSLRPNILSVFICHIVSLIVIYYLKISTILFYYLKIIFYHIAFFSYINIQCVNFSANKKPLIDMFDVGNVLLLIIYFFVFLCSCTIFNRNLLSKN